MNTESYQVFCPVCHRKFESATLKDAIALCSEHEEDHFEKLKKDFPICSIPPYIRRKIEKAKANQKDTDS